MSTKHAPTSITHQHLQGLINERCDRRDSDTQALYTLRRILRSIAPFARIDTVGGDTALDLTYAVDEVEKLAATNTDLLTALESIELRLTQARLASNIGRPMLKNADFLRRECERIATDARAAITRATT